MPATLKEDKVWFDETRKLDQICNRASAAQADGQSVLLLSHFESTLRSLAELLRDKGIDHERFPISPAELCANNEGRVWIGLARAFQVGYQMTADAQGATIEIVVAEHHPMHSRDQEFVDAAARLPCNIEISFYFSLDDPVMKYFGSDSVKALFERLGIDKGECISHHLINTAMRTAQEKIERKVGKDLPAHSAADWFKYNLPGTY